MKAQTTLRHLPLDHVPKMGDELLAKQSTKPPEMHHIMLHNDPRSHFNTRRCGQLPCGLEV